MSEANTTSREPVTPLQASAHLMRLEAGIYGVTHAAGSPAPDPRTGLPAARLSLPPGAAGRGVTLAGFHDDGWLPLDSAALIRVAEAGAQVMITIYQAAGANHPPRLQVSRLAGVAAAPPAPSVPVDIVAHIQHRGDVQAGFGDWIGERGSQRYVEGFAVSPRAIGLAPEDIEYRAVLGRDWLSPWTEGGAYCGSRGITLPILGLGVRLRGNAASTHTVRVQAVFADGTSVGPVGPGEACEAASLAAVEAFRVDILPLPDRDASGN